MPGFFICNTAMAPKISNYDDSRCFSGELTADGWHIRWNMLDKFTDDKLACSHSDFTVVLDGVILNKTAIMQELGMKSWEEAFLSMVRSASDSAQVFQKLRGAFCGAIYNHQKKEWSVFTDQIGSHLVCSYASDGVVAFGTDIYYFSQWMKKNSMPRCVDEEWEQDILEYGFMREAHTILDGVRRVFSGSYVTCTAPQWKVLEKQYWVVKKDHVREGISEEEAIEGLDKAFSLAMNRIIDKCNENGYKVLVDISGGLDSRMIAAYAAMRTDANIMGFNYSQIRSLDQTVAFQVAQHLKMDMVHFPMDNGCCMLELDDLVRMNQGMNYYFGITGGKKGLESLDRNTFGAEIYGLLGDVHEGAMIVEDEIDKLDWNYPRFKTSGMINYPEKRTYSRSYCDNEVLWFYVRGILAGMNTGFIRQNYLESLTPFGDVEFLEYNFSIPYQMRTQKAIHRKWLMHKFPALAKVTYAATGERVKLKDSKVRARAKYYYRRVLARLGNEKAYWSMNPIESWYQNSDEMKTMFQRYYDENIENISNNERLTGYVSKLFLTGDVTEKALALTVLSAIKQYIIS